ncbi:hypothetical protein GX51_07875 [Blastomyces parvus]|uniref:Uncharacterized protein n=1 Tax=Blastomyces parvus TaxID=2060905 RepID=A0A2B7WHW0_9EURO|nr:hypothetical protein GX51_07875 [Blastomyces parvus]
MSPPSKCFKTILVSEYSESRDHSRQATVTYREIAMGYSEIVLEDSRLSMEYTVVAKAGFTPMKNEATMIRIGLPAF